MVDDLLFSLLSSIVHIIFLEQTRMIKEDFVQSSSPYIKLYTRTWIPEKDLIATVIFIHGLGEHCSRYDEVFGAFANAGIQTTSFDSRG